MGQALLSVVLVFSSETKKYVRCVSIVPVNTVKNKLLRIAQNTLAHHELSARSGLPTILKCKRRIQIQEATHEELPLLLSEKFVATD